MLPYPKEQALLGKGFGSQNKYGSQKERIGERKGNLGFSSVHGNPAPSVGNLQTEM
jgi:hypothetical protein